MYMHMYTVIFACTQSVRACLCVVKLGTQLVCLPVHYTYIHVSMYYVCAHVCVYTCMHMLCGVSVVVLACFFPRIIVWLSAYLVKRAKP